MNAVRDFRQLALSHLDALYSYAVTLTHHAGDAQDLVQETYLRLLAYGERLDSDSRLKAWLFTVMRNLWFNQLRRVRQGPQFSELDEVMAETLSSGINHDPQVLFLKEEDRLAVRAALSRLPCEFREVVVLRDLEDFSYKEIAEIVGCPLGTVMSRLARGREKLKELLSESPATLAMTPQTRAL